jgi:uncharacterized protein YbaR (Trm112 family)
VISPELIELLVCPEDRSRLTLAPAEIVEAANRMIGAGTLRNRLGRVVERHLEGGLIRADGKVLYQVVDDLPIMLIDEAVPLEQLAAPSP